MFIIGFIGTIACSQQAPVAEKAPDDNTHQEVLDISLLKKEMPAFSRAKKGIENCALAGDSLGLAASVDTMFSILNTTHSLFDMSEVALFFEETTTNPELTPAAPMLVSEFQTESRKCERLSYLIRLTDGNLTRITGDEEATIAILTHIRLLNLGYRLMGSPTVLNPWDFERNRSIRNTDLVDYLNQHCPH